MDESALPPPPFLKQCSVLHLYSFHPIIIYCFLSILDNRHPSMLQPPLTMFQRVLFTIECKFFKLGVLHRWVLDITHSQLVKLMENLNEEHHLIMCI